MFKKISTALLIALLGAVLAIGIVSANAGSSAAAAPVQDPNHRAMIGQVLEIGTDQLVLQIRNGELQTVNITSETVFRSRQGDGRQGDGPQTASFEDIEVGMWVSVLNHIDGSGGFSARLVVLLPEDFDPDSLHFSRMIGEVDKINNGQNTFDLINSTGEVATFNVDGNTRFGGSLTELQDLSKGMRVGVLAVEQDDGTLLAKFVTNQKNNSKLEKVGGKVSEISTTSLTIVIRQNGTLSLNITAETRFFSRDSSVTELADLEVDMVVFVLYRDTGTAAPDAAAIIVLDQDVLDLERAIGEVQSAGGSHLTLQTAQGETLSFAVSDTTRLVGQGIEELQDIKNGMHALVLYRVESGGELSAVAILVRAESSQ